MKAYVVRTPKNGRSRTYTLATPEGELKAQVDKNVQEGNFLEGGLENETFFVNESWRPSEKELRDFLSSIEENITLQYVSEIENISEIAKKLKAASIMNRQATLRFHNDADGISSAMILSKVFQAYKQPQQSPVYSQRDAFYDLSSLRYGVLPILVAVDFGCSEESFDGYDLLKAEGIDILVIDHHPGDERVNEKALVANPNLRGNEEHYTSGYLCNEVAKSLGMDFPFLKGVSLAGDKSPLPHEEVHKKAALALDYAAFYTGYGNVFSLYKEILDDEQLMLTIYQKAKDKLEIAKKEILSSMKFERVGNLKFYYFDADSIGVRREFPPTGKLATLLSEELEEPAVIMAYTGRMVSLRVSKRGLVDLSKFVEHLKKTVSAIEGGGGHPNAASFRIRDPSLRDAVVSLVVSELKEFLSQQ